MSDDSQSAIQTIVGFVATLGFLAIAALTLSPQYELSIPVLIGIVIVIAFLLGQAEALAGVLEAWWGPPVPKAVALVLDSVANVIDSLRGHQEEE